MIVKVDYTGKGRWSWFRIDNGKCLDHDNFPEPGEAMAQGMIEAAANDCDYQESAACFMACLANSPVTDQKNANLMWRL